MQLTLRSLTMLSPEQVAIILADDGGTEVTFRFTVEEVNGIKVACGDREFSARYTRTPGLVLPLWLEQLAMAATLSAYELFPDAETAAMLNDRLHEELSKKQPPAAAN